MKRLLRMAAILVIPVMLLGAVVAYATHAVPYKIYIIHTGSMSPTIPPGSAVIVHVGEYHVGQVISFNTYNGVTTHRLVSVKDGMISTKGDANPTADPWKLPTSNVIGQVVLAPKRVGFFLEYLRNPAGAASIILLGLLVWQIWALTGEAAVALDRRREVRPTSDLSELDFLAGHWSPPRRCAAGRPSPVPVPSVSTEMLELLQMPTDPQPSSGRNDWSERAIGAPELVGSPPP